MLLSDLNGVEPKVQNVNITDEYAEQLIEEACEQACIEIRNRLRQLRANELSMMAHKAKYESELSTIAASNRARHEAERVAGIERNRIESIAESRK